MREACPLCHSALLLDVDGYCEHCGLCLDAAKLAMQREASVSKILRALRPRERIEFPDTGFPAPGAAELFPTQWLAQHSPQIFWDHHPYAIRAWLEERRSSEEAACIANTIRSCEILSNITKLTDKAVRTHKWPSQYPFDSIRELRAWMKGINPESAFEKRVGLEVRGRLERARRDLEWHESYCAAPWRSFYRDDELDLVESFVCSVAKTDLSSIAVRSHRSSTPYGYASALVHAECPSHVIAGFFAAEESSTLSCQRSIDFHRAPLGQHSDPHYGSLLEAMRRALDNYIYSLVQREFYRLELPHTHFAGKVNAPFMYLNVDDPQEPVTDISLSDSTMLDRIAYAARWFNCPTYGMPNSSFFTKLFPIHVPLPSSDEIAARYGSVLGGLAAAGVLDSVVGTFGVRCVAVDGHECNSLAELRIDNLLSAHDIPHHKEPPYPFDAELNPGTNGLRADWKIGDTFVEYFGLEGQPHYDAKIQRKKLLAKRLGLRLHCILQSQLADGRQIVAEIRAFLSQGG